MEFNEKIKNLRIEKGLKQKEVAKILGVSETCYAGYEQGYREPDFKILKKLVVIFDVSADYLLGVEDETGAKTYVNNSFNNFHNSGNFKL